MPHYLATRQGTRVIVTDTSLQGLLSRVWREWGVGLPTARKVRRELSTFGHASFGSVTVTRED